jgi:hypothetical protein
MGLPAGQQTGPPRHTSLGSRRCELARDRKATTRCPHQITSGWRAAAFGRWPRSLRKVPAVKGADSQFTRVLAALGHSLELAVVNQETLGAMFSFGQAGRKERTT